MTATIHHGVAVQELRELLGGAQDEGVISDLLDQAGGNVLKALDIHFGWGVQGGRAAPPDETGWARGHGRSSPSGIPPRENSLDSSSPHGYNQTFLKGMSSKATTKTTSSSSPYSSSPSSHRRGIVRVGLAGKDSKNRAATRGSSAAQSRGKGRARWKGQRAGHKGRAAGKKVERRPRESCACDFCKIVVKERDWEPIFGASKFEDLLPNEDENENEDEDEDEDDEDESDVQDDEEDDEGEEEEEEGEEEDECEGDRGGGGSGGECRRGGAGGRRLWERAEERLIAMALAQSVSYPPLFSLLTPLPVSPCF